MIISPRQARDKHRESTQKQTTVFSQGYGAANVSAGSLVQPSSVFRIASLTKMHTSAAILLLEQQGRLNLSDTVFGPAPSLLSNLTGVPPSYSGAETRFFVCAILSHGS
jgi:CubicO group peptidase (beta-lactamase class C family)